MLEWIVIMAMLVLSAFFSGMEIAFVSSNKIHIELEKRQENLIGKILTLLTSKPSRYIITMLIGNSVALVVYGIFMGEVIIRALVPFYPWINASAGGLLFQTVVSTLIILLTAEFLPKVFFQIYANELLKLFAVPAYVCYVLFLPVSWLCIRISDFFLRVFFKTDGDEIQLSFSRLELENYITEQLESTTETTEMDTEIQIFQNALDFKAIKAREVMIPRTEIISMQEETLITDLNKKFVSTGLSKILVHNETIDDITGYVHSFDLFSNPNTIGAVKRDIINVPETMLVKDVLKLLTKRRKSVAIVLDEYGGTSGLITIEDIVEELFGEIQDEHDSDQLIEKQISDIEYHFSARLEVDYLNEKFKLELPESDQYETLGGLIVAETEDIPSEGDTVNINAFTFTILETSNNKIDLVHLRVSDEN